MVITYNWWSGEELQKRFIWDSNLIKFLYLTISFTGEMSTSRIFLRYEIDLATSILQKFRKSCSPKYFWAASIIRAKSKFLFTKKYLYNRYVELNLKRNQINHNPTTSFPCKMRLISQTSHWMSLAHMPMPPHESHQATPNSTSSKTGSLLSEIDTFQAHTPRLHLLPHSTSHSMPQLDQLPIHLCQFVHSESNHNLFVT